MSLFQFRLNMINNFSAKWRYYNYYYTSFITYFINIGATMNNVLTEMQIKKYAYV